MPTAMGNDSLRGMAGLSCCCAPMAKNRFKLLNCCELAPTVALAIQVIKRQAKSAKPRQALAGMAVMRRLKAKWGRLFGFMGEEQQGVVLPSVTQSVIVVDGGVGRRAIFDQWLWITA